MLPTSECDFDNLKIELSVRKFRSYNRINQTFRIFFSYFNVINFHTEHALACSENAYSLNIFFLA